MPALLILRVAVAANVKRIMASENMLTPAFLSKSRVSTSA
jgi:hypothetical protein